MNIIIIIKGRTYKALYSQTNVFYSGVIYNVLHINMILYDLHERYDTLSSISEAR